MAATSSRSPRYAEKGTEALLLFRTDQTSGTALSRKIRETRTMQKALNKDGRVQSDVDVFAGFRYQVLRKRAKKEHGIDPRVAEPFVGTPRPVVCARGSAELEGSPFVETGLFRQAESCHHRTERFYEPSVQKRSEVLIKEIRRYKQEGREEGREETLRHAARRMFASGMAISLVCEILDLREEEVRRLVEEPR